MRSLKIAYVVVGALALGCGTRKKTIKTELVASTHKEQQSAFTADRVIEISHYGDVLKGSFAIDTNDTDSGVFESNGIKVKFKTSAKNGRPWLNFNAEAKPVARSKLSEKTQSNTQQKETAAVAIAETKQTVHRSWPWWFNLITILIGIATLGWAFKKIKTWIKI